MTQFSFTVPTAHLEEFEQYQDFCFGLSFLLKDARYEKYFRRKCEEGGLVYLDNSYNETLTAMEPHELAKLWHEYKPTAVISPDSDYWAPSETVEAFEVLKKLMPARNIMCAFRSDAERAYFEANSLGPLAVSYFWVDANEITKRDLHKVHSLGLGHLGAVIRYRPPTLDTSQMAKLAIRGYKLEDWLKDGGVRDKHVSRAVEQERSKRQARAEEFFNTVLTDAQLELTAHNILAMKEFSLNGQTQTQGS